MSFKLHAQYALVANSFESDELPKNMDNLEFVIDTLSYHKFWVEEELKSLITALIESNEITETQISL